MIRLLELVLPFRLGCVSGKSHNWPPPTYSFQQQDPGSSLAGVSWSSTFSVELGWLTLVQLFERTILSIRDTLSLRIDVGMCKLDWSPPGPSVLLSKTSKTSGLSSPFCLYVSQQLFFSKIKDQPFNKQFQSQEKVYRLFDLSTSKDTGACTILLNNQKICIPYGRHKQRKRVKCRSQQKTLYVNKRIHHYVVVYLFFPFTLDLKKRSGEARLKKTSTSRAASFCTPRLEEKHKRVLTMAETFVELGESSRSLQSKSFRPQRNISRGIGLKWQLAHVDGSYAFAVAVAALWARILIPKYPEKKRCQRYRLCDVKTSSLCRAKRFFTNSAKSHSLYKKVKTTFGSYSTCPKRKEKCKHKSHSIFKFYWVGNDTEAFIFTLFPTPPEWIEFTTVLYF